MGVLLHYGMCLHFQYSFAAMMPLHFYCILLYHFCNWRYFFISQMHVRFLTTISCSAKSTGVSICCIIYLLFLNPNHLKCIMFRWCVHITVMITHEWWCGLISYWKPKYERVHVSNANIPFYVTLSFLNRSFLICVKDIFATIVNPP